MSVDAISRRAASIEPTSIREVRSLTGPDTLDLGIGQTDLPIPEPVIDAVEQHLSDRRAPYSDNLGTPSARAAVGDHVHADAANAMITCGAQEALAVAVLGVVDPGDDVLVPDPGFPAFPNLVRAAGGHPVRYQLERPAFAFNSDAVKRAATDDTTALILNHPANPTGRIPDDADLASVLRWAARSNVTWISDETYELYSYDRDHVSARTLASADASGIVCGGLSKALHMMGWRLGWLVADEHLIRELKPLHQHLVTCAPTIAQRVAADVLPSIETTFRSTLETFRRRRDVVRSQLSKVPGVSVAPLDGAFYGMIDVRAHLDDGQSDHDLAMEILEETDVALIPGSGFGPNGAGFLRLSYGRDIDTLIEAISRLGSFFA